MHSRLWSPATARAVLRICRHVLDREHDAEDAFQATFLALARNGASIRDRCALVGWLQEVAYRTALKTRARRSRRRMVERELMVLHPPRDEPDDQGERAALAELRPVLQEEVIGLPDKYRLPVVLSYLEGRTNEEVATLLKWPIGTVKGRLSRGRALPEIAADSPRGRPVHGDIVVGVVRIASLGRRRLGGPARAHAAAGLGVRTPARSGPGVHDARPDSDGGSPVG